MAELENRIKVVLAEKKLKSKELAESINRDYATISRWCNNKTQPSLEALFEISQFLDVDIRELLLPTK